MFNLTPALELISRNFKENDIKYSIIGSTALFLQGIKVKPHDIDLVIEKKDARKVNELLMSYLIRLIPIDKKIDTWGDPVNNRGLFEVCGIKIEIGYSAGGETENGIFMPPVSTAKKVVVDKVELFVSPLFEQVYMYKNWYAIAHREKYMRKIELIDAFLRKPV
jgi:hypothetical protein